MKSTRRMARVCSHEDSIAAAVTAVLVSLEVCLLLNTTID